jgi:hypothetical protein
MHSTTLRAPLVLDQLLDQLLPLPDGCLFQHRLRVVHVSHECGMAERAEAPSASQEKLP